MAGAVAGSLLFGVPGAAHASQDIRWTWNSDDNDVEGRFVASGEHIKGAEYDGPGYIDWRVPYYDVSGTWYIPGTNLGDVYDLNLSFGEDHNFYMTICQAWSYLPDDCSDELWGLT